MNHTSYIGIDAFNHFPDLLRKHDVHDVFLVHGNRSYSESGAESLINQVFVEAQCSIIHFTAFSPNPKQEETDAGVELLGLHSCQMIVTIGGGSAMDTAKLIRYLYFLKKQILIPLVAIPTTSGTGAEATQFAVVYRDGIKQSVDNEYILPDYAFVLPQLTYKNNAYLTACTGFDAFAQAVEAYWNVNASEESDQYAIKAIELISRSLVKCVNAHNNIVREQMSEGAYWAGRAINITRTTAPHAFSYAFTSKCGYPHGHAVAITFPFFAALNGLEYANVQIKDSINRQHYASKLQNLKRLLGFEGQLSAHFEKIIKDIHLKYKGCGNENLKNLLSEVNQQRLKNNPVEMTSQHYEMLEHYIQNYK